MRHRVARLKCEEHERLFHSPLLRVFFSYHFSFILTSPNQQLKFALFVVLSRMQILHSHEMCTRRYNIQNAVHNVFIVAVSAVFSRVFFFCPSPSFFDVVQSMGDKNLTIFENSGKFPGGQSVASTRILGPKGSFRPFNTGHSADV